MRTLTAASSTLLFPTLASLWMSLLSPLPAQDAPASSADGYEGKPFNGTPMMIPGTLIGIDYDLAPNDQPGITFNYGGKYGKSPFRPGTDAMGIGGFDKSHLTTDGTPMPLEGGYLGWTQNQEWAKYTVQVTETATYRVGGQFAAGGNGSRISLAFTPTLATGPLAIPTTAGIQPGVEVYHVWEKLDNLTFTRKP